MAQARQVAGLKARLQTAIRAQRPALVAFAKDLNRHPELGYQEERTAEHLSRHLKKLALSPARGLAGTGMRVRFDALRPGPTLAILGEMDGLIVPDHPAADPATGAAHACGHHLQLVRLLAVAQALVATQALRRLHGAVDLLAVPAEEVGHRRLAEVDGSGRRTPLRSGKTEFLRAGEFDDVAAAILIHATSRSIGARLLSDGGTNGLIMKRATFTGRASHAAQPAHGVNALNAASLALQGIAMQRETFRDEDHVRVHSILVQGATPVNVIPSKAVLETGVRAVSVDAIKDAEAKVDRSFRAGAMAIGASVDIETTPGYLPRLNDWGLTDVLRQNAQRLLGADGWIEDPTPSPASTDAGDLSHLLPVSQVRHGGTTGTLHTADFRVIDYDAAVIQPAIVIAWAIVDLLKDEARGLRTIVDEYRPRLSKESYFAYLSSQERRESFTPSSERGHLKAEPAS